MVLFMILLTLVIAYATAISLAWAIREKKGSFWAGFLFCLGCTAVAVWFTVNTYLGVAPVAALL